MKKTFTMQDLLKNQELLNILSVFREEGDVREYLQENDMEVDATTLYNLKKTLESESKQIENSNNILSTTDLKGIAGGANGGSSFDNWLDNMCGDHDTLSAIALFADMSSNLLVQGYMAGSGFKELRAMRKAETPSSKGGNVND